MNIQIFGLKKCSETRKAQRFFKERRIPVHFVDLSQKEMSKGELRSVAARVPLKDIIDTTGRRFIEKRTDACLAEHCPDRNPAPRRRPPDTNARCPQRQGSNSRALPRGLENLVLAVDCSNRDKRNKKRRSAMSEFSPGQVVVLRSDPSVRGAVVEIVPGEPENRFKVFCGRKHSDLLRLSVAGRR